MEDTITMEHKLLGAACAGHADEISELLPLRVSVDACKYNSINPERRINRTPLQVDAAGGHAECVKLLPNHGADPNGADHVGLTPLMLAAMEGNLCSMKALLTAGAHCGSKTNSNFRLPVTQKEIYHSSTALHFAAANNHSECVRELIQFGSDCSAQDGRGRTSLFIAAESGFEECVFTHIDNATSYEFLSVCDWDRRDTPLHLAIEKRLENCVQALVCRGADVNFKNKFQFTPLHNALEAAGEFEYETLHSILMEGHNPDISILDLSCYPATDYVCTVSAGQEPEPFDETNDYCGDHLLRNPRVVHLLLACGAKADVFLENKDCTVLEHELNFPDCTFKLLKCIFDVLPPTRVWKNLTLYKPQEFTVKNKQREVFTRMLIIHLQRVASSTGSRFPRLQEMYLTSNDPTVPENLRILWPPNHLISKHAAECYIAFHLANPLTLSCLSYEDFNLELLELWHKYCVYLKKDYYSSLMRNPRSLKSICRWSVRKILSGNHMVRNIKKLPIPISLQSYLLFYVDNLRLNEEFEDYDSTF